MIENNNDCIEIIEDEDGIFFATANIQGCYTQGDTLEEARERIIKLMRLHIETDKTLKDIDEEVIPASELMDDFIKRHKGED